MRTFLRSKATLLFLALGLLLAVPAVALANNVINADLIDYTSQNASYTAGDANGVVAEYWVEADADGCDPGDGTATSPGALSFKLSVKRQIDGADVTASSFKARLDTDAASSAQTLNNFTLTLNGCAPPPTGSAQFPTTGVFKKVVFTSDANLAAGQYKVEVNGSTISDPNDTADEYSPDNQNSFLINVTAPSTAPSNHAPTVSTAATDATGNEGSELTTSGAFADQDTNDTLTITQLSGAGSVTDTGNGTWSWSHTPNDNGTGTVVVQASDGHPGGTVTDSFDWTADNVNPTITNISASVQNALVNSNVTFMGTATDPSSVDTQTGFFWQWSKDGGLTYNPATVPNNPFAAGGNPLTTSFSSCGTKSVSAKATDKDLGTSLPVTSSSVSLYNGSFLPPIDTPAVNLTLKGKVLPVKISVGCNGQALTGLAPSIKLLNGNVTPQNDTGTDDIEAYSTSAADTTGWMRPVDGGYIYNLQVPGNATANQELTVRVNPFAKYDPDPSKAIVNPEGGGMYALLKIRK